MLKDISMIHVAVAVNNICHKGCPDCYYPKGEEFMTHSRAKDIAKWIFNTLVAKTYLIEMVGGEPLYSFNEILTLTDEVINRKPKESIWTWKHPISVFTNGDLLNEEILKEMKSRRMGLSLNPTHDSIPVLKTKIELIQSVLKTCRFALCLDEFNLSRIEEITKLAIDYKIGIRTNRLYDGGNNPSYVEAYRRAMLKMLNMILEAGVPITPQWMIETTVPMPHGLYGKGQVGYYAVVDYDGTVRNCNPDLTTRIGNIYKDSLQDLQSYCEHSQPGCHYWHTDNVPECHGCEWEWMCRGGCPYTRKLTYGTYNRKSPFCSAFKELYPVLMKLVEIWKSNERKPTL